MRLSFLHLLPQRAVKTRTWARNVTATYTYDDYWDLIQKDYSDGTPSVYLNNYNRAGQPRETVDGTGTNELAYDYASRLMTIYCTNGLLTGMTVSNHFNPYYGRDALTVAYTNVWNFTDDYGYDSYGRLATVGSGIYSAAYGYVPNSDLLQTTTCSSNYTTILTTTRTWDYGFRLHGIANTVDGTPVTSHMYVVFLRAGTAAVSASR
jgi:hypothetical protein